AYAFEEAAKSAVRAKLTADAPQGAELERFAAQALQAQLGGDAQRSIGPLAPLIDNAVTELRDPVYLWPRRTGPKGDLIDDEMGRVLQMPGWSNIFTQPIINRVDMLSTGIRTDIGVKVFGPDLEKIDRVCRDIEKALKPLNGARDVVAAPIM